MQTKPTHCMIALLAFTAVAMQASGSGGYDNMAMFDTDSSQIGVHNRCTGCISHKIEDFEGPLIKSNQSIKGFGGTRTANIMIGTIVWKWQDDNGAVHKFIIPKSFYMKEGNVRLLSPQHWAQTQKDAKPQQGSETVGDKVTLFWKQRKHKLTITFNRYNNVTTFNLAAGYTKFMAFYTEAEVDYAAEQLNPIICLPAQMVSDDDETGSDSHSNDDYEQPASADSEPARTKMAQDKWATPTPFDLDGKKHADATIIIEDEEDHQPTNQVAELLQYHHQFGHISFRKLVEMAKLGIIPKRLAKCATPTCSACLYAKAIKRAWRIFTRSAYK
jgi:hypothetical protein